MNYEQAKSIPLSEILDKINCQPARTSGHDLYYLAPWRNERTASLHVNTHKNVWYDHGIGEGGGVIQFVCKYLESAGLDHAEADARRWLKNMFEGMTFIAPVKILDKAKDIDERKSIVTHVQDIEHPALIQYLESRGLLLEVVREYYKQVSVYNKQSRKSIFALGMKNESGGYALRNKFYEGCAGPNTISFIRGTRPKPDAFHVFEGGPDFVTAVIRQNNGRRFEQDTIVLHSVSNLKKATPFIKGYGYQTGFTWMHNDKAGEQATANLKKFFQMEENLIHVPMNSIYAPYKDMNAFHMAELGLLPS